MSAQSVIDPVALSQALIRCPSVTPVDAGVIDTLRAPLEDLGFTCERKTFAEDGTEPVDNLYARIGDKGPNFCFGGHLDVVPVGDESRWTYDPFAAEIHDGVLFGRGATDMKTAVAAFVAAAQRFLAEHGKDFGGSISMLITNDEETVAINGTRKVLKWLDERGEALDLCIVGEPTNPEELGDMVKIGRRGSLNGYLTVKGIQGHTAYPHMADNPISHLVRLMDGLISMELDDGTEHFQPSTLEFSTVDVGNPATNVIPAEARATFNIRFNDAHSSDSLIRQMNTLLARIDPDKHYDLDVYVSGESFICPPGDHTDMLISAIKKATGKTPELSTTGGTSDARFFKDYCTVAEFGLVGKTMHKVDEQARVEDIHALSDIYLSVLNEYFEKTS